MSLRRFLGPLLPVAGFLLAGLLLLSLSRLLLAAYFHHDIQHVPELWRLMLNGLRMDLVLLCALSLPVALIVLVLPARWLPRLAPLVGAYFSAWGVMLVFMELASGPFLAEFGNRPNQLFFQYLTHPREVLAMVWKSHGWLMILALFAVLLTAQGVWHWQRRLAAKAHAHPLWLRLLVLPLVIAVLFLGARSGLGRATPNPAMAAFSNNHLANQLALSGGYSILFSAYRVWKGSPRAEQLYGRLPAEEVYARVRRVAGIAEQPDRQAGIPTLHHQPARQRRQRPLNLVIIIMEGMGAEFVASLGGAPVTPNLERLAQQGIWFSRLYATGTRTSRGLEALVSAFPPLPYYTSILKMDLAQHNFFTIGGLLRRAGYHTSFIYGGEGYFDNMRGFLLGNGFEHVIDGADFDQPRFVSSWGVSDEDILAKANEHFKAMGEQPFLSVVLTLSNHAPYEFPEGDYALYEQPRATARNSARYADYALGRFFEQARREPYFEHTVFLLAADHPMRVRGNGLVPVEQYRIVALLLAPGLKPRRYEKLASQLDLLPTALGLLGLDTEHPMIGRDLLALPESVPGRAIMQYDGNQAYRRDDDVVIFTPGNPARQFRVGEGGLGEEVTPDPELVKDALAHVLFPGYSYYRRNYRLPDPVQPGGQPN